MRSIEKLPIGGIFEPLSDGVKQVQCWSRNIAKTKAAILMRLAGCALIAFVMPWTQADAALVTISIDEASNVRGLPIGIVAGHVFIREPVTGASGIFFGVSDELKFGPGFGPGGGGVGVTMASDADGDTDPADTVPMDTFDIAVDVYVDEIFGRAIYTPKPGQPGFIADSTGASFYTFEIGSDCSDACVCTGSCAVPEPGSLSLLYIAGAGLMGVHRRLRPKGVTVVQ